MASELITTLILLGAAQGLFLTALLATKPPHTTANRILAVAMLAFSLYLLSGVYYAGGWYEAHPAFIGLSVPLIFVFGPIHYLYARAASTGGAFLRSSLLHFLPFLLVTLYLTPFFLQPGSAKLEYVRTLMRDGPQTDLAIIQQLQFPHGIVYVVLTILLLQRHRSRLEDNFSSLERINLIWLRNLTIGIASVWAIATTLDLLDLAGLGIGNLDGRLTPLAVACLVYGAGYLGLRQPEIFHGPTDRGVPQLEAQVQSPANPSRDKAETPGYQKSGLSKGEASALMERLKRVMVEKALYRNSQLSLQELADELSISAHNLSEVINTQAGRNFFDFVNGYRVEEAMRRLRDPRNARFTILAIAVDAGFNSKATFNAFFKRHTGLTPSAYRSSIGTGT